MNRVYMQNNLFIPRYLLFEEAKLSLVVSEWWVP